MILLDRLEVFNISASGFFIFSLPFSYSIFKNGRLSGASFQHYSSNDHYSSGDSNSLADSQKVMRRMLPRSPRSSPEFPGKLIPQICILYTFASAQLCPDSMATQIFGTQCRRKKERDTHTPLTGIQ